MMKNHKNFKKITAVLLSALLVLCIVFPFVFAGSELLPGQKELFVKNVTTPPVQDGIINGHQIDGVTVDEYGSNGPTMCLYAADGDYRVVDLEGNALDAELPSYIYLYLSKDADALYVGMEIQEDAHAGDVYELTTFLGFGDGNDADSMNSGTFTTFEMNNDNSVTKDPGTWMDTQVTALSAQTVAADGTVTDTTASRRYNDPLSYALPAWGSESKNGAGDSVTILEAELDFQDALKGSGITSETVPGSGYFAFELGVYSGTEKVGKIVFDADLTGTDSAPDGEDKTVPHLLNLTTEYNSVTGGNANLSALSAAGYTLSPDFNENTTEYEITVPNGTSAVEVIATAVAEAVGAKVTIAGADELDSFTYGAENKIVVTCVAQNNYTKYYTIKVNFAYESQDYWVSASGSDENNGSETAPFATIEKALQTIAANTWEASQMATIHLTGSVSTISADEAVLFSQKTIFTTAQTKLPITIKGTDKATSILNISSLKVACANDYRFENMTIPVDTAQNVIYAGSGEIYFANVAFTTGSIMQNTPRFYGDTFTAKVFEDWNPTRIAKIKNQNENGNIATSVTLGTGSDYWVAGSAQHTMVAVGDNGGWDDATVTTIQPTDTEPAVINDGAKLAKMSAVYETNRNQVALARVIMKAGQVHVIGADIISTKITIPNSVSVELLGGSQIASSSYIRGGYNTTIQGDLTITVENCNIPQLQGGYYECHATGNVNINVGGTSQLDSIHSGFGQIISNVSSTVGGTVTTRVYGDAKITNFYGVHNNVPGTFEKVVNEVEGGTITNFYGLSKQTAATVSKELINNISGGTITNFYGTYGQTLPSVTNNVYEGANFTNFYGVHNGSVANSEVGTATNNFYGGSFTKLVLGMYANSSANKSTVTTLNNNISGGSFAGGFRPTIYVDGTTLNNNISGGTISGNFDGGYYGTFTTVNNTVSGGTIATFYGYRGSKSTPGNVGTLNNTFTGGTVTGGYNGLYDVKFDTLNTTISDGTFEGAVYTAFCRQYDLSASKLVNNISGGTFKNSKDVILGGYGGIIGSVENTVTGNPKFTGSLYLGGGSTVWPTKLNTVINKIYSGTFENAVYGGGRSGHVTGDIKNTLEGGNFKDLFYGSAYAPFYPDSSHTLTSSVGKSVEGTVYTTIGKDGSTAGPVFSASVFGGERGDTAAALSAFGSIEVTVYGGTFNGNFYGGSDSTAFTNGVTNKIHGGTFNGYYFGGSYASPNTGDITNEIHGGTFNDIFYGGSQSANITGNIFNNVKGGTFNGIFFGGSENTSTTNTIVNTIDSGNFVKAYYGGSACAVTTTTITNNINGGNFTENYYGGGNGNISSGSITNIFHGGKFNAKTNKQILMANDYGTVTATVTSEFYDGFDAGKSYVYGGTNRNTLNAPAGAEYVITNTIHGGKFKGFWGVGGLGGATVNGNVKNIINGGTFDVYSSSMTNSFAGGHRSATLNGNVVSEINGGTFKGRVAGTAIIGASDYDDRDVNGMASLTIKGGRFEHDIYAESPTETSTATGGATLTITAGAEAPLAIFGSVTANTLTMSGKTVEIGADTNITVTGIADGSVTFQQTESWKKQVYVTLPAGNEATVTVTTAEGATGTYSRTLGADFETIEVKGGVAPTAATMILTDRIAVRVLFAKETIDGIEDFTYSFTMSTEEGTVILAEGNELAVWEKDSNYYYVLLQKVGVSDFDETITLSGSDEVWEATFSIVSLAEAAESAWEKEGTTSVQLAQAIQDLSAVANGGSAPHELSAEPVDFVPPTPQRAEGALFNVTGKGLLMSNAVGIRIYGTVENEEDLEGLTVTVNGTPVTELAVITSTPNEETDLYDVTVDLYVSAKNMENPLTIVINDKKGVNCLTLTDRVDAIAASYTEEEYPDTYRLAEQLLIYIQKANAYGNESQQG